MLQMPLNWVMGLARIASCAINEVQVVHKASVSLKLLAVVHAVMCDLPVTQIITAKNARRRRIGDGDSRPVTRGAQGGEAPLQNFPPPLKNVLDIV